MNSECPKTVVILAGGISKRFGSYKMLFPIGGKPLINHLLSRIEGCYSEVYISVRYKWQEERLREVVKVDGFIYDEEDDLGPLSGIMSASTFLGDSENVVFIPGDNLWVDGRVVSQLFTNIYDVESVSSPYVNNFVDTLTIALNTSLIRKFEETLFSVEKRLRPSDIHRFSTVAVYPKYSVKGIVDLDIHPGRILEESSHYQILNEAVEASSPQKYYRTAIEKLKSGEVREASNIFFVEFLNYKTLNIEPLATHAYKDYEWLRKKL